MGPNSWSRGCRNKVFENIIGHERIVEQLGAEITEQQLPGALLFYGDAYTGKLSTALELARVMSCREKGEWSCQCSACRSHRVLDHPYTLMLGTRYFIEEISASADALLRSRSEGARYLYIRALKKLARRFDPIIWEGNDQRIKKVQSQITSLEEELEALYPGNPLPEADKLKSSVDTVALLAAELARVIPRDNIPIDHVRAVNSWVHTTSAASPKIVIFENADRMGAGSRNALLKTLEEPPESACFILLSTRKGRIMPTILSRVRQYHFPDRGEQSSSDVLRKIFRIDGPQYQDLRSFFLAYRGVPLEKLHAQARHFFSYVWGESEWEPEKLEEFLTDGNLSLYFVPFLEELSRELQSYMHGKDGSERLPFAVLEKWSADMRQALVQFEHFNQSPDLLLEGLLYSMKESMKESV